MVGVGSEDVFAQVDGAKTAEKPSFNDSEELIGFVLVPDI